jgi:hypothetical protein
MQAFAISVVLMSSACGETATTTPYYQERELAAIVRTIDCRTQPTPYVASFTAQRYDSGKGDRHVPPLSGRRGAASSQR